VRIGIFGGSFNPIHNGHIALAKGIMKTGLIDELWFIVSPHNPLKKQSGLMPDEERLQLVNNAVKDIPGVKASDFEFNLPKPSYMYYTLEQLQLSYPDDSFTLIIGADNWECFEKWKNYQQIINTYPIIIYPRQGYDIDAATLPDSVTFVNLPLYNISSTQIREMIKQGKDVSHLVPKQ